MIYIIGEIKHLPESTENVEYLNIRRFLDSSNDMRIQIHTIASRYIIIQFNTYITLTVQTLYRINIYRSSVVHIICIRKQSFDIEISYLVSKYLYVHRTIFKQVSTSI